MVETTADVRRDIELTRERMSSTLAELEHKLNVAEVVRDHPWPALALAFGAGVLLSGSGSRHQGSGRNGDGDERSERQDRHGARRRGRDPCGRRAPGGRAARHRLGGRDQGSDRRAAAPRLVASRARRLGGATTNARSDDASGRWSIAKRFRII